MQALDPTPLLDADVHPRQPTTAELALHMEPYWREAVEVRGIDSWESIAYPTKAPLTARPEIGTGPARSDATAAQLAAAVLGPGKADLALCHQLFAVQAFRDANMAAAFARAVNDWTAVEWLDREPRFRASIVIPLQAPDLAVEEIERRAADRRFIQVLVLAMGEQPLGNQRYWPIYAAAEKHGLPLGVHAGSSYHHAVTGSGWPSHYLEDYAAQSLGFHTQLGSFIAEGVFVKFPKLKVVMIESGVTWVPSYLWRLSKFWRGVRLEVPWLNRSPLEIVRDHVRFTTTPFDAPTDAETIARVMDQLGSDDLLIYGSDFPHWHADAPDKFPALLPKIAACKTLIDNALATFPRLGDSHAA